MISNFVVLSHRLGQQEDAITKKSKDFLISSLIWSLALYGAKDLLLNKQITFITIAIVLIMLFGIRSRTTQSDGEKTFINLTFLIVGCVVVGVALDSIVLNSFIKWVIYGMFLVMVATNPKYQQIYLEMKQIFKSMCEGISSILKNLLIQSQGIIKKRLKIIIANQEEPPMNDNIVTRPVGSDGRGVGEDIV